jgi:dienelactone hydrolase
VSGTQLRIPLRSGNHYAGARAAIIPGATLVVLTHGMCSGIDGDFERNLEQELQAAGFSTLLFNSYAEESESRSLQDISLSEHVEDLDDVVAWVRTEYNPARLILVGHSLGGLVALLRGDEDVDALVLCDPSEGPGLSRTIVEHGDVGHDDRYHCMWDEEEGEVLLSRALVEQLAAADGEAAAAEVSTPMLVISAGKGVLTEVGSRYAALAHGSQEILDDSEHAFLESRDAQLITEAIVTFAKDLPAATVNL